MSQLLNMLSRLVITFLPRSKHLLISWLQLPSAVILEPQKIKSDTVSTVSPSISHEVMGPDAMKLGITTAHVATYFPEPGSAMPLGGSRLQGSAGHSPAAGLALDPLTPGDSRGGSEPRRPIQQGSSARLRGDAECRAGGSPHPWPHAPQENSVRLMQEGHTIHQVKGYSAVPRATITQRAKV